MERFQQILAQATKLKESQLKNERKNFESLPQFLKSGLAYSKKYINLRAQNYFIQHYVALKLKEEGNSLFQQLKYSQASSKYQQALSIFRFITASTNQNLKDQHLTYQNYQPLPQHYQIHAPLLQALYLNICSCLTKMNRKDEAVKSAEEALSIQQTTKGHYKKAHAYLDYINRDNSDIKLGFYQLNTAYQMSKDRVILEEMQHIKNEIDKEKQQQKQWFKFMFQADKRKTEEMHQPKKQQIKRQNINQQQSANPIQRALYQPPPKTQSHQMENQFNDFLQEVIEAEKDNNQTTNNEQANVNTKSQLIKTKQKLAKYVQLPNQIWQLMYQRDFLQRYGSKIYSILQIYNYKDYAAEYRSVLGQCLDIRDSKDPKISTVYSNYFKWLQCHPFEKIKKYLQRYDLQTQWIIEKRKRGGPKDEIIKKIQKEPNKILQISFWRKNMVFGIIFVVILLWKLIF